LDGTERKLVSNSVEFQSLPLHDSILRSVELLWESKRCRIHFAAFSVRGECAREHVLEFFGVSSVRIPIHEEWGPSISVNEATRENNSFKIEMQSGDTIVIEAQAFAFSAAASAQ